MKLIKEDAPAVLGFDNDIKSYCLELNRKARGEGRQLSMDANLSNLTNTTGSRRRLGNEEQECTRANRLILAMDDEEYNSCWNIKWQTCAARGKLPGQQTPRIVFATPPAEVEITGTEYPAFASCSGFAPHGCNSTGFAQEDIFFLELCAYSKICANNDVLFQLKVGQMFTCEVSPSGIRELRHLLLAANRKPK